MGTGDWNDGMNKVGARGKGESVWMAFFLYHVAGQFKPLAQARDDARFEQECEKMAEGLEQSIDQHAWDGEWFLRAYFDDGRSDEHTSELQYLMRISYAVFCLNK